MGELKIAILRVDRSSMTMATTSARRLDCPLNNTAAHNSAQLCS
jgi:hypothetical protein